MRTILALGLGAAAYSMRDRKNRKRVMNMIQPVTDMIPRRTVKQFRKRIERTFS